MKEQGNGLQWDFVVLFKDVLFQSTEMTFIVRDIEQEIEETHKERRGMHSLVHLDIIFHSEFRGNISPAAKNAILWKSISSEVFIFIFIYF